MLPVVCRAGGVVMISVLAARGGGRGAAGAACSSGLHIHLETQLMCFLWIIALKYISSFQSAPRAVLHEPLEVVQHERNPALDLGLEAGNDRVGDKIVVS